MEQELAMSLRTEAGISDQNVSLADRLDVAVLIPCYNEADTIRNTVRGFRGSVPSARIYVFDNNSHDGTAEIAVGAGAIVRRETAQGKGNVIRRMFSDIDAEIYIIVDGDGTYDAEVAPRLLRPSFRAPMTWSMSRASTLPRKPTAQGTSSETDCLPG